MMTLDELAVWRWILLSDDERARSEMGPPLDALRRIVARIGAKLSVDRRLLDRAHEIRRHALAPGIAKCYITHAGGDRR